MAGELAEIFLDFRLLPSTCESTTAVSTQFFWSLYQEPVLGAVWTGGGVAAAGKRAKQTQRSSVKTACAEEDQKRTVVGKLGRHDELRARLERGRLVNEAQEAPEVELHILARGALDGGNANHRHCRGRGFRSVFRKGLSLVM